MSCVANQFPLKFITVHCSATKPSVFVDRDVIDRWHRSPPNGWLEIGYHFVIKRDGTVQTGRAITKVGAHVLNQNVGNVGICLAGGLNEKTGKPEDNYTDEQKHALALLLHQLVDQYGIDPDNILGHRDWPKVAKECPCFDTREWVAECVFPKVIPPIPPINPPSK